MDESHNDPVCRTCGNDAQRNTFRTPNVLAETVCQSCTGTIDGISLSELCLVETLTAMGIVVNIPTEGSVYRFSAPNGICLDTRRLSGAIESMNAQLPTGSFQGYISSLFSTASTTLATSAKDALFIIMISIIVFGFVMFAIIIMILIAGDVISAGLGIGFLFVGLFVSAMTLVIILAEISSLSIQLENNLFSQVDPAVETLRCALIAGVCCYSGPGLLTPACCCGKPSVCRNVVGSPCMDMP